jgi:hypothetical protein
MAMKANSSHPKAPSARISEPTKTLLVVDDDQVVHPKTPVPMLSGSLRFLRDATQDLDRMVLRLTRRITPIQCAFCMIC